MTATPQVAIAHWGAVMAQRTTVTLQDDLDGGPAAETVRFALSGREYEIDLGAANAARFRQQIAPFIEHARKAAASPGRPTRTVASRQRSRDVRAWARQQGIAVNDRGRIPAGIVSQYEAAATPTRRRLAVSDQHRSRAAGSSVDVR